MATRATARGANFESNTAVIGWSAPRDTSTPPDPMRAWYSIDVPEAMRRVTPLAGRTALTFEIVDVGQRPSPLSPADTAAPLAPGDAKDTAAVARKPEKPAAKSKSDRSRAAELPADSIRVDLTVDLVMGDGQAASVPLSAVAALRPPLTIRLFKYGYIERKLTGPPRDHEYVMQRVEIPFARFAAAFPGFDPTDVRAVRFRFDRTPAGTVLLDDVGFETRP